MSTIFFKNRKVEKLNLNAIDFPTSAYENKVLELIKAWIENQETFLYFTSGSTGAPKSILLTRQQMIASAAMTQKALGLQKGDAAFVCLDVKYIAGTMMVVRSLEVQMDMIVVEPTSHPFEGLPDLKFDFTALVPLQLQSMLNDPASLSVLKNVKTILLGGVPANVNLASVLDLLPGKVYSTFGMTETASHIALQLLNGPEKTNYYSAIDPVKIGFDDRNCLTIQGPVTNNKVLITNDLVKLVGDNKFEWFGRIDNVINSGGIKVPAEGLEKQIQQILKDRYVVNRFFIAGIPDTVLNEKIILIIEGNLDAKLKDQLMNDLRFHLEKFTIPKLIGFIPQFKETSTGKIDRKGNISHFLTLANN